MLNTILKILVILILLPVAAGSCIMCGGTCMVANEAAKVSSEGADASVLYEMGK